MMTDAVPMQVHAKTGRGRPKEPIEKRRAKSDTPHKNRITPPDIPTGTSINPGAIPKTPPIRLGKYEKECWKRIADSQRAMEAGAWIFRSDSEFLIATCILYGRLRQVREEINELKDSGCAFVDPDTGRANPLLSIEKSLATAYQQALKELAMVPTRRQVVEEPTESDEEAGLA